MNNYVGLVQMNYSLMRTKPCKYTLFRTRDTTLPGNFNLCFVMSEYKLQLVINSRCIFLWERVRNKHTNHVNIKVSRVIGTLWKIRNQAHSMSKTTVYIANVQYHLQYCFIYWTTQPVVFWQPKQVCLYGAPHLSWICKSYSYLKKKKQLELYKVSVMRTAPGNIGQKYPLKGTNTLYKSERAMYIKDNVFLNELTPLLPQFPVSRIGIYSLFRGSVSKVM